MSGGYTSSSERRRSSRVRRLGAMVFERTRPSRPAECTLRRMRATSGCGASSSSTPPLGKSFGSSLSFRSSMGSSSVGRHGHGSVEVVPGSRRRTAGWRFRGLSRNSTLEVADAPDQLAGGTFGLYNLAFDFAATVRVRGGRFRLALEAGDQIAQIVLDRGDLVLEPRE